MRVATKIWFGASIALAIIAGVVFFVFFYDAHLTIVPDPATAVVGINGQTVAANTSIKLAPGTYTVTAQAPGYLPAQQTVTLHISDQLRLPITLRQIPSPVAFVGSVQFPALTTDGQAIVYLGLDGKQFLRVATVLGSDGKPVTQAISPAQFDNITAVVWSPDRNLAIIQTSDGNTQLFDFKRYDFLHQELRPIGKDLRSIVWSPDGTAVVAFESTPAGDRSLVRWDVATGQLERLVDLRPDQLTNPTLAWSPDGGLISLVDNNLFLYDTATRTVRQVAGTSGTTAARWSPDGRYILTQTGQDLALVDLAQSNAVSRFSLRTTIDKSAWLHDSTGVLAAVSATNGQDDLVSLTLADSKLAHYRYASSGPITVTNPIISQDDARVWFINQGTLTSLLLAIDRTKGASE